MAPRAKYQRISDWNLQDLPGAAISMDFIYALSLKLMSFPIT